MEHAHDEASLVHDYRRPRRLPPLMSGTPAYAFAPHEMAWSDPALPQSVSSASSASQASSSSHYSSLASNRADRGYELEASPSFVQPRYPPEVYPRTRDGSEMDAALTDSIRYPPAESSLSNSIDAPHGRRVGRQDRSQSDESYVSYELHPIDAHTRESPPAPSHYYGVFRPERTSSHLRYSPYRPLLSRHPDSISLAGSDHIAGSPVPSCTETEASSSNSQPYTLPAHPPTTMPVNIATMGREKNRKTRLYSEDRRRICKYQLDNPKMRQEDIAKAFRIERSTVSKILKQKEKWLSSPEEPQALMSKYRSAKYPVVELPMEEWVKEQAKLGTIFTDAMIRVKALEIASGVADAKDKFKASPGWIENFKARMGIRKGVYHGDGKGVQAESILGRNVRCPTDDNAPGRRHRATIPTEYKRKANGDWPKAVVMMEEEERQYKIMIGGYVSQPVGGTDGMDGLGGLDDTDDADSMNGLEDEERGADEDWQSTSNMPHVTPTTEQHDPAHMDGSPPLAILPPNVQAQPPHVSPVEHTPSHRAPFPGDAALGHGVETAAETQIDLGAQYQEEPDYVKAIELVMGLSRRPEFKKYAELRDEDDDCLVNMVQAIKTWSRGQPHRRR